MQEMGLNQNKLLTSVSAFLQTLGIFKIIKYIMRDNQIMIYAVPNILYKDMLVKVPKAEWKNFGYTCTIPSEDEIVTKETFNHKVYETVHTLVGAYIKGGRKEIVLDEEES